MTFIEESNQRCWFIERMPDVIRMAMKQIKHKGRSYYDFPVASLPPAANNCYSLFGTFTPPCVVSSRAIYNISPSLFPAYFYTLSFPFLLYSCLSTNGKSTRFPLSKRPPCSHVCGIRDVGLSIHSYTDCSTDSFSLPLSRLCTCQDQPLLYQCSSVYTCGAIATWYSSPRVSSGRSIFSYLVCI